jgi:hypothetical protein
MTKGPIAVVGATGYTGVEYWLRSHAEASLFGWWVATSNG